MEFFVDCLGASREVGRSAFMVHSDRNFFLDYGIKIFDASGLPKYPLETPLKPDFAILAHAHLDHSGSLPILYNRHKIRWYGTPPTNDICELLWKDNMKIMGDQLPYGLPEFKKALTEWTPLVYGQTMQTGGTRIRLSDAGHIAGSAMVEVEYGGRVFLYTSDFKCGGTYMHKGAAFARDVDTLMIESTYATREHPPRKELERRFMEEIHETLDNGGNVLLPSFALGRTQELIATIRKHDRDVPVFVDGMGREVTKVYMKYPKYIRDAAGFRKAVRSVSLVEDMGGRKAATREPSVIIATSGMMNGGPILSYLFNVNSQSKLIFTGYCVEGTNGWTLQNKGHITKDGQELQVDLPVEYMDFSAHAGRSDLLEFIKHANPGKVLLVHGDAPQDFAEELRERHGFDALAPLPGERVAL